jgi:hypothetical protein
MHRAGGYQRYPMCHQRDLEGCVPCSAMNVMAHRSTIAFDRASKRIRASFRRIVTSMHRNQL